MVLYKRKPVPTAAPPADISDNAEVWSIDATDEVFTDYEKFLARMDFLNQRKFTDAVNGKSNLTFFAAQESESQSSKTIDNVFPEVLRDPILRKVQFSTIGRMDDLVNHIYEEFKRDFFPGEDVIVVFDANDAVPGVIREKAKFPIIRGPDGAVVREAFSRYFVKLPSEPNDEALVGEDSLRRDRKVFTKQNLRSFLKNSLQREAWTGAPWLVKEHLAVHYQLPMEIPVHLLQDFKLMQTKVSVELLNSPFIHDLTTVQQGNHSHTKPAGRKRSKLFTNEDIIRPNSEEVHSHAPQAQVPQLHYTAQAMPKTNGHYTDKGKDSKAAPIKYPIEDLDVPPNRNGVTRPELKFFTQEMEDYVKNGRKKPLTGLTFESLSMLLEIWTILNVQCEVYVLDSFTFDDFVDAMKFSSTEIECELLNEMFCAVLTMLVAPDGGLEITLPKVREDTPDVSEVNSVSEASTPVEVPSARSTRRNRQSGNDVKMEDLSINGSHLDHRASELLSGFYWRERLAAREMESGGWQMILVGLLSQLSHSPRYKARVDYILSELAPVDEDPSRASLKRNFAHMDTNARVSALQIITDLSVTTKPVKEFLETCSEDQTEVRKKKIEYQRERKVVMEELLNKDKERRATAPETSAASPIEIMDSSAPEADGDVTMEEIDETATDSDVDLSRSLRRGSGRKRKRDEEQARVQKEKAEKAAAAESKQSKEYKKLVKDIEKLKERLTYIESKIGDCDADLREANVQRIRVLGTDRFCNRYYWFERNGQPFAGLPTSSTAHYGFANGCIWVQGPDEMEREGFIDLPDDLQAEYRARFRMTVPERRRQEEGATSLQTATEWGLYDDTTRLDSLMAWLDERGEREKKLLKELREWREEIAKHMDIRKNFLEEESTKKAEADEEQATRISTRHAIQMDKIASAERCLRWHNSMAIEEIKHLHSQDLPRAKVKKPMPKGVAVLTSKAGKPVTRQGSAYGSR